MQKGGTTKAAANLSCSEKGLPLPGGMRESAATMASTLSPLPFRAHAQYAPTLGKCLQCSTHTPAACCTSDKACCWSQRHQRPDATNTADDALEQKHGPATSRFGGRKISYLKKTIVGVYATLGRYMLGSPWSSRRKVGAQGTAGESSSASSAAAGGLLKATPLSTIHSCMVARPGTLAASRSCTKALLACCLCCMQSGQKQCKHAAQLMLCTCDSV